MKQVSVLRLFYAYSKDLLVLLTVSLLLQGCVIAQKSGVAVESTKQSVVSSASVAHSNRPLNKAGIPNQWEVPFLTLRSKEKKGDDLKQYFGSGRGGLSQGYCDVVWHSMQFLQNINKSTDVYIPSGTAKIAHVREMSSEVFWTDFKQRLGARRPVLYIHGYKIGFDKGCKRARTLQENLALRHQLILFSWPSNGAATNYMHDEADMDWSVRYLEEVLLKMADMFGEGGFDVIAHSMGARGLASSIVRLSEKKRLNKPLIGRLIFIAADMDAGVFKQQANKVRAAVNHFTVYVSRNDRALSLSRELHGYPRLGQTGKHLISLRKVEIIDISDVPVERVSGHLYHLGNKYAMRDMNQLINQRFPAENRDYLIRHPELGQEYWKLLMTTSKENSRTKKASQ